MDLQLTTTPERIAPKKYWILPLVCALLILPIILYMPLHFTEMERHDHMEQSLQDMRWLEQTIQLQVRANEQHIATVANGIGGQTLSKTQITDDLHNLLNNEPEIHEIIWLDALNEPIFSTQPFDLDNYSFIKNLTKMEIGRSLEPRYLQPDLDRDPNRLTLMNYVYPITHEGHLVGSLVVRYNMQGILNVTIPSWVAQEYELSLMDSKGDTYAIRADNGFGRGVFVHDVHLNLKNVDLILHANSIKVVPRVVSNYLIAVTLLLGLSLVASLLVMSRDSLRRQAAEAALFDQMEFRRAMELSLMTGLAVYDLAGQLIYVNPAFCHLVGYTEGQLLGSAPPMPFWTPVTEPSHKNLSSLSDNRDASHAQETLYRSSNGTLIPVLLYESALMDEHGNQKGWMSSVLDLTERKKAEEATRRNEERIQTSSRLATMGELASVMAHELNQPLTAISNYAAGALMMIKSSVLDIEMLKPALESMNNQARRAGQIIRSVHDFVVKREPRREKMMVDKVFASVQPLIELQAKSYAVKLQASFQSDLPAVLGDAVSLEQVLLNLTRNALQAMQGLPLTQRVLQIVAKHINNFVIIEVIDFGPGISEEVAQKLFSAFFSTKAEGMGMGLNICRTIIEFHGGELSYRPNPAGGAIFSFNLPVAD